MFLTEFTSSPSGIFGLRDSKLKATNIFHWRASTLIPQLTLPRQKYVEDKCSFSSVNLGLSLEEELD